MKLYSGYKSLFAVAAAVFLLTGFFIGRTMSGPGDLATPVQARALDVENEQLPDIIERVIPAVVNISSKRIVKQNPMASDPFFRDFFRRFFRDRERVQRNLGSGVIVNSEGYILTSNHLVNQAEEIKVTLPDKREFDAEVIGTDSQSDVAVIKIEGDDLPVLETGDSDDLRLGETVIAVGYPFGVGQTVTKGIVSALGRSLKLVDYEDFIQTDAAINPGNSGGALINIKGELIGINTAIVSRSGGSQGIGFAIPINLATSIMESITEHGYVIRGYLGVFLYPQDITPGMAEVFGMESTRGALISEVSEDTPADRAGLKSGDVVVRFNGVGVEDSDDLRTMVADVTPGTEVEIEIIRDGEHKELEVEIGERPESEGEIREESPEGSTLFLGVALRNLNDYLRNRLDIPQNIRGVVVTDVSGGSPAAEAGLKEGDVILEINRQRVENINDMRDVLDSMEEKSAVVRIFRQGHYHYLEIDE